jgi:hypothetical protein
MMQPYHDAEVLTKILNDAESTPTSLEYGIEVMSKYDHFDSIDVHTSIVNCILSFCRYMRNSFYKNSSKHTIALATAKIQEKSLISMMYVITDLTTQEEWAVKLCTAGALDNLLLTFPSLVKQTFPPHTSSSNPNTTSNSRYSSKFLISFLDALSNLTTKKEHAAQALQTDLLIHGCAILEQCCTINHINKQRAWEPTNENKMFESLHENLHNVATSTTGSANENESNSNDAHDEMVNSNELTAAIVSLIRNLSAAPHSMRPLLAASGVVSPLVSLVGDARYDSSLNNDLLATLLNISTHDAADDVLSSNETLPVLISSIENSSAAMKLQDFDDDAENDAESDDEGEEDYNATAADAALICIDLGLRAVRNMCSEEYNAVAVCKKEPLGVIVDALTVSSNKISKIKRKINLHANVTQSASMVLENVATFADEERCSLMVQMGVVEHMVTVLGKGTSDAKSAAADTLVSLMQINPNSIKDLLEKGIGGSMLVSMIELRLAERIEREKEEEEEEEEGDEVDEESVDEESVDEESVDEESIDEEEESGEEDKLYGYLESKKGDETSVAFGSSVKSKSIRPRPTGPPPPPKSYTFGNGFGK